MFRHVIDAEDVPQDTGPSLYRSVIDNCNVVMSTNDPAAMVTAYYRAVDAAARATALTNTKLPQSQLSRDAYKAGMSAQSHLIDVVKRGLRP